MFMYPVIKAQKNKTIELTIFSLHHCSFIIHLIISIVVAISNPATPSQ